MFINVQLMEIDVFLKTSAKRDVKKSDVFATIAGLSSISFR